MSSIRIMSKTQTPIDLLFPDVVTLSKVDPETGDTIKLGYQKFGKLHQLWGPLYEKGYQKNLPKFGKKFCLTEKMDGTQIGCYLKHGSQDILLFSHNGNTIFEGNIQKLQDGVSVLSDKATPYKFQGTNLSAVFPDVIRNMLCLMDTYNIQECCCYFELILAGKSPRQMNYPSDLRGKPLLFCMVFPYQTPSNEERIAKMSITPTSIKLFQQFDVPTVKILLAGDSLTLEKFQECLDCVHDNPSIEGGMFHQKGDGEKGGSALKFLTHHNSEPCDVVFDLDDPEYAKMNQIYSEYMKKDRQKNKLASAKKGGKWKGKKGAEKEKKINGGRLVNYHQLLDDEIEKELTHDDYSKFIEKFNSAPDEQTQGMLVSQTNLWKDVVTSLEEEDKLSNLRKSEQRYVRHYLAMFLREKKTQSADA